MVHLRRIRIREDSQAALIFLLFFSVEFLIPRCAITACSGWLSDFCDTAGLLDRHIPDPGGVCVTTERRACDSRRQRVAQRRRPRPFRGPALGHRSQELKAHKVGGRLSARSCRPRRGLSFPPTRTQSFAEAKALRRALWARRCCLLSQARRSVVAQTPTGSEDLVTTSGLPASCLKHPWSLGEESKVPALAWFVSGHGFSRAAR